MRFWGINSTHLQNSSTLELPKIMYNCQDAYPKKVTRLNICSISLILSVEIVSANFSQLQR